MPTDREGEIEHEAHIRRLRWRCRRGTKELDRILGGFFEQDYPQLADPLKSAFAELLEQQDPQIYDWLTGAARAENPEFAQLVQMMRQRYQIK